MENAKQLLDDKLYEMIFKRKSFHIFRNIGDEQISADEIEQIEKKFYEFQPLVEGIKVKLKIVKDSVTCKRGQEYCILLYSEKKDHYLQNVGYIGEQLDLYLASKNIGTLWFGIGKTEEQQLEGLDFVIMIAISKIDSETKFRKDMFKSKRKDVADIWMGETCLDIANIVRFAPSACNTQPWIVEADPNQLSVYRYKKQGKRGIMPADKVSYYNQIDIGIFLCFMELCLNKNNIEFRRELFVEEDESQEKNLTARYYI